MAPSARGSAWRAALRSAAWLGSEKLLRLLLALGVGVAVARHLGPADYGRLNLAMSWVGLLGCFAWFGVGDAVTRDMVRDRRAEGLLLGSAFVLRTSGVALALACIGMGLWSGLIPIDLAPLVLVLCWTLPAGEMTGGIWLWFQSHLRMARAVMVKHVAMLAGSAARLVAVGLGAGALAMAWTFVLEAALVGLGLVIVYRAAGQRFGHWRFDLRHAWAVFMAGTPLLLSAMVAALNARLDQLMLGWLAGPHEVGLYAAATRFSEIWWVVPTVLMQSFAPRFLFARGLRAARLRRNVAWAVLGLTGVALVPCLLLSAIGQPLTHLLLGARYDGAGAVLVVHVWVAVAVFADAAQNQALLARGQGAALVRKSLGALLINAVASALLVPRFGAVGAALATLAAHLWAAFLFYRLEAAQAEMRAVQARAWRSLPRAWRVARWLARRRPTVVVARAADLPS